MWHVDEFVWWPCCNPVPALPWSLCVLTLWPWLCCVQETRRSRGDRDVSQSESMASTVSAGDDDEDEDNPEDSEGEGPRTCSHMMTMQSDI